MSVKEYLPYVNNLLIYGTKIALQNWEFIRSDSGRLTFFISFFFLVAQKLLPAFF